MAEEKEKEIKSEKDKVITPVANGKKKEKKLSTKIKESFIADEALSFKDYLIKDLIVPIIKDAICDGITNGLSMLFYGEPADYRRRDRDRRDGYRRYNYSGHYTSSRERERDRDRDRDRARHSPYDFELIECETKSEALDILDQMDNILEEYESVSIADMYDLAGVSRTPEDNNFGWTNLSQAKIEKTRDGLYIIQMPRAKNIK